MVTVNSMTKKERLNAILALIDKYEIDTQEELTSKLNQQNYNVSQATVSRDIAELNIIKISGIKKKFRYSCAKNQIKELPDKIINLFRQVITSIDSANNLIIIKTLSGNANTAGTAIDAMHIPQVMGTIAGDDTLLIVAKNQADAEIIVKNLRNI